MTVIPKNCGHCFFYDPDWKGDPDCLRWGICVSNLKCCVDWKPRIADLCLRIIPTFETYDNNRHFITRGRIFYRKYIEPIERARLIQIRDEKENHEH